MTAAVAPLRWHLSSREVLPMWFGYQEKKPLTYEQLLLHRKSLSQLDVEFEYSRQQGDIPTRDDPNDSIVTDHSLLNQTQRSHSVTMTQSEANNQDLPSLSSTKMPYKYTQREQSTTQTEQKNPETETTEIFEAETTESRMEEGREQKQEQSTKTDKLEAEATEVPSAKTMGAYNATYEAVDPVMVARVDEADAHSFFPTYKPHSAFETHDQADKSKFSQQQQQEQQLHDKESLASARTESISAVPVMVPVATPVDAAVKQSLHPELAAAEEEREEERAAAVGAGSAIAITVALAAEGHAEEQAKAAEQTSVLVPVAESAQASESSLLAAPGQESSLGSTGFPFPSSSAPGSAGPSPSYNPALPLSANDPQHLKLQQEAEYFKGEQAKASGHVAQLANLHEHIIRKEKLDALGPDITAIKVSPPIIPAAPSNKMKEMHALHLAQQEASKVTHTVTEKQGAAAPPNSPANAAKSSGSSTNSSASPVKGSRIAEMKRLHEQKIKEEEDAKNNAAAAKANVYKNRPKGGKTK